MSREDLRERLRQRRESAAETEEAAAARVLEELRGFCIRLEACRDKIEKLEQIETRNPDEARILAGAIKDARDRNRRRERDEQQPDSVYRRGR